MCDMNECLAKGEWHPILVFTNDRGQRARAVVGLSFCRPCSRKVKAPEQLFRDKLDPLVKTLNAERVGLDWSHVSAEEVKLFLRVAGRPS